MSRRSIRGLTLLGWIPIATWLVLYVPAAIRSIFTEGAGSVIGLLIVAIWLFGPALIMVALLVSIGRTQFSLGRFARIGLALLLISLGVLIYGLFPSPWSNRDLFLPTVSLLAFLVVYLLTLWQLKSTTGEEHLAA